MYGYLSYMLSSFECIMWREFSSLTNNTVQERFCSFCQDLFWELWGQGEVLGHNQRAKSVYRNGLCKGNIPPWSLFTSFWKLFRGKFWCWASHCHAQRFVVTCYGCSLVPQSLSGNRKMNLNWKLYLSLFPDRRWLLMGWNCYWFRLSKVELLGLLPIPSCMNPLEIKNVIG